MSLHSSIAPHVYSNVTTRRLMLDVVYALLPCVVAGLYFFGYRAAIVLAVCIASCMLSEFLFTKITKKPNTVGDCSALVTGLILGLNLPSTAPWWMCLIGSVCAIVLVKMLFGGLGDNFMNPALTARGILLVSWPVHMTHYVLCERQLGASAVPAALDAVSSATPLGGLEASYLDLFLGNIPGSIGETCKVAILIGLVFLLVRGTIKWYIPVTMMVSTALFSFLFGMDPLQAVLSGGVFFGAVFMATDYTTSPMGTVPQFIYAAGAGLIVALIRAFGGYPEGVTFAILLMNIVTPLLDKYIRPKVYGEVKRHA